MNIKSKHEKDELFYLEHFLRRAEIKPESVERGQDPPDFYVAYGSNRIAIEVTEYHSLRKASGGRAWRAVEEEWWRIRDLFVKKRERYHQLNDVYGFLFFRELEMPPTKKHDQFVTELLEFGTSQCKKLTEERSSFDSFPPHFPLLNEYMKKIWLKKVNCYMTWDRASATYIGISEEELEKCVSKKLKIPRPQQITENWLLIVSGTAMSQQIGLIPSKKFNDFAGLNKLLKTSPFDKIFFFQYVWKCIICWSANKQWEEMKSPVNARGTVL